MDFLNLKRRTISEEIGDSDVKSHLVYRSETFGGLEEFTSENLRNEGPLEIAERLEEMAAHFEELPPPDADVVDLKKQILRLREEASAIRMGGVNIFEDKGV